jgi:hypothetical protein
MKFFTAALVTLTLATSADAFGRLVDEHKIGSGREKVCTYSDGSVVTIRASRPCPVVNR